MMKRVRNFTWIFTPISWLKVFGLLSISLFGKVLEYLRHVEKFTKPPARLPGSSSKQTSDINACGLCLCLRGMSDITRGFREALLIRSCIGVGYKYEVVLFIGCEFKSHN